MSMPGKRTFTARIENAGGGGAFVQIPFDAEQAFGSKRPKVKATIDGLPYRGTLVRMGAEYHILGVLKEIRGKIGKDFGDEITVIVRAGFGAAGSRGAAGSCRSTTGRCESRRLLRNWHTLTGAKPLN